MDGYDEIPIRAFDALARAGSFIDGPYRSTFGDGYGEPYVPDRQVFGTLNSGRKVCAIKPADGAPEQDQAAH